MANVTQTVKFKTRLEYYHFDRRREEVIERDFETFDGMFTHWRKERRRRAKADRATGGKYRMVLTSHGKDRVKADDLCRESHRDAIDGTWFNLER